MGNMRVTGISALVLAAALALSGCGVMGGKKAAPQAGNAAGPAVKVDEGSDLSDLSRAIKTKEDQEILDLMLGYRMLLLRNPDAKSLDKETLSRSRDAFDRLETLLRHGGVRSQDAGERVYTITNQDKLSLQEVILSASQAANKDAREGDWDKARARWKEITQSKAAVTFTMEEAQWGLTLADALQSNLPDSLKKRLKDVNESYAADVGHEEIGKQVKALLEIVPDVKLQRELKKLANRAWEKDKRAGRITSAGEPQAITTPPDLAGGNPSNAAGANAGAAGAGGAVGNGAQSGSTNAGVAGSAGATGSAVTPGPEAAALSAQADSLASQGKYVASLKVLEQAGDQAWAKDKKAQIGDRFCEDKRRSAANSFKDFKKAAADSTKRILLKRTEADLDSCLFYFPEVSVSQKVRKNREMVEGELKKLK